MPAAPAPSSSMVALPRTDLQRLLRDLRDHQADLNYWSRTYRGIAPTLAASFTAAAMVLATRIAWLEAALATISDSGSGSSHC